MMRDPTFDLLAREQLEEMARLIQRAIGNFTVGGRLNLGRGNGATGVTPPEHGGTGNTDGEATPLDGSVTNVKVATGADIDPAKLDQTLLLAAIYLLVKAELVAGSGIAITPNDGLHTLTISALATVMHFLDATGGVDLAAAHFLRFGAGSLSFEGPDGALYLPPVITDGPELAILVPVLDEFDVPIEDGAGHVIYVYAPYVAPGGPLRYAESVGDGAATSIAVTHALGTADVIVQVREVSSGVVVYPDVAITDADTVTLDFAVAPATDAYRVVVLG